MGWMKAVWAAQLGSAVLVLGWAVWNQPTTGQPPDWVTAISAALLVAAYLLARRSVNVSDHSTTALIAAWSLCLAAVSLSAGGRWLGASLWQLAAIAAAATVLLFAFRPLTHERSLKDH